MPKGVYKRIPPEVRFWSKITKGPADDACWVWNGTRSRDEYGILKVEYGNVRAHRYSYEMHVGPIPAGLMVLHKCDNPPCVNPAHLSIGTAQDNSDDAVRKSRRAKGSSFPQTKLNDSIVKEMRDRFVKGNGRGVNSGNGYILAREYQVSTATLYRVVNRQTWKHVP